MIGRKQCGFLRRYEYPGRSVRDPLYQLLDPFTVFHERFIAPNRNAGPRFWSAASASASVRTWSGYAFERVCLQHVEQIKRALGVSGVVCRVYAWRTLGEATTGRAGAQIDLVIDRDDRVVNLCEMKCSAMPFAITKSYSKELIGKREAYRETVRTDKALHLTMVTTQGLVRNAYAGDIQSEIVLDDLFVDP